MSKNEICLLFVSCLNCGRIYLIEPFNLNYCTVCESITHKKYALRSINVNTIQFDKVKI